MLANMKVIDQGFLSPWIVGKYFSLVDFYYVNPNIIACNKNNL
jgi:hypothetical protein